MSERQPLKLFFFHLLQTRGIPGIARGAKLINGISNLIYKTAQTAYVTFGTIAQRGRHVSKIRKHVVLPNNPF